MGAIIHFTGMAPTMGVIFILLILPILFFHLPTISDATDIMMLVEKTVHKTCNASSSSVSLIGDQCDHADIIDKEQQHFLMDSEESNLRRFLQTQPRIDYETLLANKAVCYNGQGSSYLSRCSAKSGYPPGLHPCLQYYLCR